MIDLRKIFFVSLVRLMSNLIRCSFARDLEKNGRGACHAQAKIFVVSRGFSLSPEPKEGQDGVPGVRGEHGPGPDHSPAEVVKKGVAV
jgi:hypothetical protein